MPQPLRLSPLLLRIINFPPRLVLAVPRWRGRGPHRPIILLPSSYYALLGIISPRRRSLTGRSRIKMPCRFKTSLLVLLLQVVVVLLLRFFATMFLLPPATLLQSRSGSSNDRLQRLVSQVTQRSGESRLCGVKKKKMGEERDMAGGGCSAANSRTRQ